MLVLQLNPTDRAIRLYNAYERAGWVGVIRVLTAAPTSIWSAVRTHLSRCLPRAGPLMANFAAWDSSARPLALPNTRPAGTLRR